jgi:hypothetical protein
MACLGSSKVAETKRRMIEWIVNNEMERMWKETVIVFWQIGPLLGDEEVNMFQPTSIQQYKAGKHGNDYTKIERLFSVGSALMSYLEDSWLYRSQLRVHLWNVNQRVTEEE